MEAKFRIFRAGPFTSWSKICQEAADYASAVGPKRIISISHSSDGEGVVVVWYWARERRASTRPPRAAT